MSSQVNPYENSEISQNEFKNVVSVFKSVSCIRSGEPAIVFQDKITTYGELDKKSDALASYLIDRVVQKGGIIAVCMKQSPNRIMAFLGVLKIGSAYLPLDDKLPESRIKLMLAASGAELIITDNQNMDKFATTAVGVINMDQWDSKSADLMVKIMEADGIDPMQTAYIIFTSGSTGTPKGVKIHHEAFYTFVKSFTSRWGFSAKDRTLQFSSPGFDVSIIDIWIPLLAGATEVLYPDNKIVGRPLLDFIVDNEIDVVPFLPPAVLNTLPFALPIGKLHTLLICGEVAAEQAINNWYKRVRLINAYGPTETTVAVTSYCFLEESNPRIIGRPLDSADVYILDKDYQSVDEGITGEIYIGGRQLATGYINRPDETKQFFIEAPEWLKIKHGSEYRLYKSGDHAFWRKDGNIEFVGRIDDQVKVRGFRIELKEIEHHICQLAQVANAAVKVYRPENGLPILVAFIELYDEDKDAVTLEYIRTRLKRSLPTYMLPEKIILYDKLPISLNGKIDKSQLHIPLMPVIKKTKDSITDLTDLKQNVMEIWMDLLSLDDINEDADFFELGGHSLMLAQAHQRLPLNVQKRMPLPELYSYPTVRLFVQEAENRLMLNEISQQQRARLVEEQLLKDAALPFDFEITKQPDPQLLINPSNIFLTGVTGFVGSHLLEELIDKHPNALIYCLVRAENESLGWERIKSTFSKFKLVWKVGYESKIKILLGDLTEPGLGLNETTYIALQEKIEVIYHMGSNVSYIQPYEYIKKPNVDGMAHILHLAVHGRTKFLIISSSMGVYSWGRSFTGKTFMTEQEPIDMNLPAVCRDMGYIRSKWVMDKMASGAREKGLPIINFRLGFVVCHGETGATPLNQWWSALTRSCIELKAFPLIMDLKDELITVDYVCKAIAHISKQPAAVGLNFNLNPLPEHDLSLTDFFVRAAEYCGLEMKGLDFHTWFEQWSQNQELPLYSLLYLFNEDIHEGKCLVEAYENTYYFKSNNTIRFLEGTDISPAIFDKKVMEAYLRYMKMI